MRSDKQTHHRSVSAKDSPVSNFGDTTRGQTTGCTVDRVGKRVATGHLMRHAVCCVSSVHRQRVELTFGPRRDEREERREVAWSVLNADEKSAGKKISFLKLGKGMTRDTRSHAHSHTCPQTLCLVAVIL